METKQESKVNKTKSSAVSTMPIRVKRETKRRLLADLAKVNKKDFGKKVRLDELLCMLLPLLTDAHIKSLQNNSMSNADRFEIQFREHIKAHGVLSKDEYLGLMLANKPQNN